MPADLLHRTRSVRVTWEEKQNRVDNVRVVSASIVVALAIVTVTVQSRSWSGFLRAKRLLHSSWPQSQNYNPSWKRSRIRHGQGARNKHYARQGHAESRPNRRPVARTIGACSRTDLAVMLPVWPPLAESLAGEQKLSSVPYRNSAHSGGPKTA